MSDRNGKSTQPEEQEFAQRARQLFDESVEGLDAQTRSRLNRARQQALASADSNAGFRPLSPWVPATGVAAAAVIALAIWGGSPQPEEPAPTAMDADFEILLNADSLEMLEDLEFYSWLDLDAIELDENVG